MVRQRQHGNSPRAVLMKGAPTLVNELIDRWHKGILRRVFEQENPHEPRTCLDVGCGYGRLATEASACGLFPVIGMDFTPGFCADFAADHGPAVCGKLTALPFVDSAFEAAYCVTALMYLSTEGAREALHELDRCLEENAQVLVIEPAREFNASVRFFARKKRSETLAQPGLAIQDMSSTGILPARWRIEASGGCSWMTWSLPLLVATSRWPRVFWAIANWVLRRDTNWKPGTHRSPRFVMYRWVALRVSKGVAKEGTQ